MKPNSRLLYSLTSQRKIEILAEQGWRIMQEIWQQRIAHCTPERGDIWLADLNLKKGSEQADTRPVLIFQNDSINKFTTTFLAIPLTTNLTTSGIAYLRKCARRRRRTLQRFSSTVSSS